jgi:hypothetical protein
MTAVLPLMYTELADWWPVLSAPADYAEEAAFVRESLVDADFAATTVVDPWTREVFLRWSA